MKIISCWFEPPDSDIYKRLTNVFKYSIKKNMPDAILELYELPFPVIEGKRFQAQMEKQRFWTKLAKEQTENYIVMDSDMMVMGDLSEAFKYDFDIAYTSRKLFRKPLNGGMIFCIPSEAANLFWDKWLYNCEEAYNDKRIQNRNNSKCKGFAQSALWYTINNYKSNCNIIDIPCQEWNACDEEWMNINYETVKAIHIKGRMRKALFGPKQIPDQKVYDLWRDYERQCYSSNS
jgi:hypothetical protein